MTRSNGVVSIVRVGAIATVMPFSGNFRASRYVDNGLGDRLDEAVDVTSNVVAVHVHHGLGKMAKRHERCELSTSYWRLK